MADKKPKREIKKLEALIDECNVAKKKYMKKFLIDVTIFISIVIFTQLVLLTDMFSEETGYLISIGSMLLYVGPVIFAVNAYSRYSRVQNLLKTAAEQIEAARAEQE